MDDLGLDVKTNGAIEMAPAHRGEVTARVSIRNVMPKTAKTLGLAGRYIQVRAYGRTANADRAHKRLAQVGLPIEHRVINRNGSQLNLILAILFSDVAHLRGALDRARDAGFADAYVKQAAPFAHSIIRRKSPVIQPKACRSKRDVRGLVASSRPIEDARYPVL